VLIARLVLDHRLGARDPLAPSPDRNGHEMAELLFAERKVELSEVAPLLT
jgi:hypothetical protein